MPSLWGGASSCCCSGLVDRCRPGAVHNTPVSDFGDDQRAPSVIGRAAGGNPQSPGAAEHLELPLERRPYFQADAAPRDEDGWAPVPDASAVRGRSWESLAIKCREARGRARSRRTKSYYEELFHHVDELHEADMLTKAAAGEGQQSGVVGVEFIYVSLICNALIFSVKAFSAASSGSLVLLASALDSLLDILSGSALSCVAALMRRQNKYVYPVGKTRMEPLGVIVFATLMGSCSLQVLIESVKRLLAPEAVEFTVRVWALILGVIAAKGFLYVFGRRAIARAEAAGLPSGALEAQTDDHRNDVLTNGLSLLGAYFASAGFARAVGLPTSSFLVVDPLAAMLFSVYVMKNWGGVAMEQMKSLVGKAGPPELIRKITYLALTHCEEILAVDTVRAFTFGPRYIVEVDIVLSPDVVMRMSHDIGESLQVRMEALSEVERCYIHMDWEVEHRPEHRGTV